MCLALAKQVAKGTCRTADAAGGSQVMVLFSNKFAVLINLQTRCCARAGFSRARKGLGLWLWVNAVYIPAKE